MSDFTGQWLIETVYVDIGNGSHAPQRGSVIRVSEERIPGREGPFYGVLFVTQGEEHPTPAPLVAAEYPTGYLKAPPPPPGTAGYSLNASCSPDRPTAMTGQLNYQHGGLEDVDIATFTATKTTYDT